MTTVGTNSVKDDRPFPGRQGPLPRELEDINAEWLSAMLARKYPGVVVEQMQRGQLINSHTTKLRVKLTYNTRGRELGLPENACLKSNWSEGFESGEICELEARFYFMMQDALTAPVPASYFADWDGDGSGRGVVMLEDLGCAPGEFGNSLDHLGVDGVAKGLESLADLHAALWDSPTLDQRWLHRSMDTPVDTEQVLRMYNYSRINMDRPAYREFLPDWLYETPERFAHAFDQLAELDRQAGGPLCLVHGDSHQGNSFLRENGERVWMDWQLVRKGKPWRDVVYFMLGALTVEERRGNDRALVKHYYDYLKAKGVSGLESAERALELCQLWPAYGMQAWMSNMDVWGQSGGDMIRRFWTAAADYETVERLTAGKSPRREIRLGEGAREVSPAIKEMLARGEL